MRPTSLINNYIRQQWNQRQQSNQKATRNPCMCPPTIYIIILYICFIKATEPIYIRQPNPIIIIYYQMKVISLHSTIIIMYQYAATHIDL
jgi:hypothetical protein